MSKQVTKASSLKHWTYPGKVATLFRCRARAEVADRGRSATVLGEKARLAIQPFGPAVALQVKGPNDWGRSWIFTRSGVRWFAVTGEYTAGVENPLVAALTPLAPGAGAWRHFMLLIHAVLSREPKVSALAVWFGPGRYGRARRRAGDG